MELHRGRISNGYLNFWSSIQNNDALGCIKHIFKTIALKKRYEWRSYKMHKAKGQEIGPNDCRIHIGELKNDPSDDICVATDTAN